jgi:D-glycero-D-manno-heptose 1,7-bisphosphate phosphatase
MLRASADALGLDLSSSWMVGDTDADIAAGAAAGCRTLLVCNPASVHKRLQTVTPDLRADSLTEGATGISTRMSDAFRGGEMATRRVR